MTGTGAIETLRKLAFCPARQRSVMRLIWAAAALLLASAPHAAAVCAGCAGGSFGPATFVDSSVSHDGAPVAYGDFDGDGHVDLVIEGSSRIALRRGTGAGLFEPESVVFEPGAGISGVAVGDFNGDGHLDLAVAHPGNSPVTPGGLSILLGNGSGGFAEPIEITGGFPSVVITADFDGDGKLDLATASWEDGGATILFGSGDGNFGSAVFLPVQHPTRALVAADFDGDGKADLSVPRQLYVEPPGAFVFLHTGPRTFGSPKFLPAPDGQVQAVADFDNDGRPDLFIQGVLYLNRGGGTFEAPFGTSAFPVGVPGDFNGDGRVDLVLFDSTGAIVYPGDGLGSFGAAITSTGLGPGVSFALDVNEDGALDLIGRGDFGGISVTLGRGDGTFDLTPVVPVPTDASAVDRADFTGDGIPDLALISGIYGITIVPGLPGGGFGSPISVSASPAYSMAIADFNQDGRKDLAVITNAGIEIRLGLAGGGLGPPSVLGVGPVSSLSTGDVNNDGHADLAFIQDQRSRVILGNGNGTFGPVIAPSTPFQADNLVLADLNGDGKADLVLFGFSGVSTYLGDGAGDFVLKTTQLVSVNNVLVVDLNGDSRPDVIASPSFLPLKVFLNDGAGGLAPAIDVLLRGFFPGSAVAADFNGDGVKDVAILVDSHLAILIGDGAGHFSESSGYETVGPSTFFPSRSFLAADLDGDGKPDLVGVGGSQPAFVLWTLRNTNCVPRRLALTTNVGSCGAAGAAFSPQPVLRVSDDGGNLVSCATGSVSAAIVPGTGTPGATLSGTTTVPVAGGVASFTNLSVDLPGSGYRLAFSHSVGGAVQSRSVTVAPAPPPITVSNACTVGAVRLSTSAGAEKYRWSIDGVVVGTLPAVAVSGLAAGPHALSLSVTRDGCATVSSQTLTVSASPSPPGASSNSPVPFGQTLQLTATTVAGAAYDWTGPGGFSSTLQNPAIPAATPALSGVYRVAVRVGACSSADASVTVTVLPAPLCSGCAGASFGPAPRALSAPDASNVVAGDFNGDGIPDLAVGINYSGGGIRVFPGTGNGDFGASVTTAGAPYPQSLFAADFDRDGTLDVLYFQSFTNTFAVQLGRGDGTFEPPVSYSIGSGSIRDLAVGDFNEDGFPDAAFTIDSPNQILILLGSAAGGFSSPSIIPLSEFASSIATGIFRPGGHRDLVVGMSGSIAVFFGAGNGSFAPGSSVPVADRPFLMAVGDIDGDGAQDLAVANGIFSTEPRLFLYRGNSDGTFSLQRTLPLSASNRLWIADLDGDGHSDLAFFGLGGLSVLFGRGGWEFEPLRGFGAGEHARDFAIADFDGDGRMDAAVSNSPILDGFVAILRGVPGGFEVAPTAPATPQGSGAVKGDFNGDGLPDLAVLNSSFFQPEPVSILFNDGLGGFLSPVVLAGTEGAVVAAVDNLDGDGRSDLVVPHNGGLLVFHGSPSGPPTLYQTIPDIPATGLAIADFNSDGKRDLAVASFSGITILPGDGAGGFSGGSLAISLADVRSLQVADFNGDGKPDLLLNGAYVAYGNGNGSFQPPIGVPFFAGAFPVVAGDVNGDGKDDLVGGTIPFGIGVALSNGPGFQPPVIVNLTISPSAVAIADINGDGHKDLVLSRGDEDLVTMLLADGLGSFLPGGDFLVGRNARGIVVADLDNDGRPEVVVFNFYDGTFSILHNTRCVPRRLGLSAPVLSCAPPGSLLSPQPVVKVQDDGGNLVSCAEGQVTASIKAGTGAPGAALGGTKTVNVINGVATFSDLSIDLAGTLYQLEFHRPVTSATRTAPFSVGNPPAAPVAGNNGPVCVGEALELTASLVNGGTYRWTGPNGFVSRHRNPVIPNATALASGTYSVTVTVNGCTSAPAMTVVTIIRTPPPEASNSGPICAGQTLQLFASTVSGATYAWTGPSGFTSSEQNPQILSAPLSAAGVYSVTATANGCTSSPAATNVTIRALPSAVISMPASICATSTGNGASVPSAGAGATYSWSITNGTITSGAGTRAIVFTAGAAGSVRLDVTVTNGNGCVATGTKSVSIVSGPECGRYADKLIYRPGGNGTWYVKKGDGGPDASVQWGTSGDVPAPSFYTGSSSADFGVFRPSNGTWYVKSSSGVDQGSVQWGASGDIPVPGQYGGDGRSDYAVWRPGNGTWYVKTAEGTQLPSVQWGTAGDIPVPADYDGDGVADFAVFRPSTGTWYVKFSGGGTAAVAFGAPGDIPVPAAFTSPDGTGRADYGIFRPSSGTWYVKSSQTLLEQPSVLWGTSGDVPLPSNMGGDARVDKVVWRPSSGTWYALSAEGPSEPAVIWGTAGDTALAR